MRLVEGHSGLSRVDLNSSSARVQMEMSRYEWTNLDEVILLCPRSRYRLR